MMKKNSVEINHVISHVILIKHASLLLCFLVSTKNLEVKLKCRFLYANHYTRYNKMEIVQKRA